jgi:hypothetical protein
MIRLDGQPCFRSRCGHSDVDSYLRGLLAPRCANSHVGPDNVPMWSGSSNGAKPQPHGRDHGGATYPFTVKMRASTALASRESMVSKPSVKEP